MITEGADASYYYYFEMLNQRRSVAEFAERGQLDRLVMAREEEHYDWDQTTCWSAARTGHFSCLAYALEHGCRRDDGNTCALAALHGHMDCLQLALSRECPWDEDTCVSAAKNGHVEIVRYALSNGCPVDNRVCPTAAEHGHVNVLQLAAECGLLSKNDDWSVVNAAFGGHLHCLAFLLDYGCAMSESAKVMAAAAGHYRCFVYLHERGCPGDAPAAAVAAKFDSFDCVAYARENRLSWSSTSIPDAERVCKRWWALRTIARWALKVRRRVVRRAAHKIADGMLRYLYRPGGTGYAHAHRDFIDRAAS